MLTGRIDTIRLLPDADEATKLTVYVGRQEKAGAKPVYEAVVDLLHRRGIAGATVLLGVDGTAHGVRQRAKFFGRNAHVPLMVIAIGDSERVAGALPELGAMLARPLVTLERVRVCKRDGERLAEPRHLPNSDASGLGAWQKLMVYAGEQSRHNGHPLYLQLIRAPRSRRGGRDQPARRVGLSRRSCPARRLVLATAAARPRRHGHRRHARTHPRLVRHRRRHHRRNRARDQRDGTRLPRDRPQSSARWHTPRPKNALTVVCRGSGGSRQAKRDRCLQLTGRDRPTRARSVEAGARRRSRFSTNRAKRRTGCSRAHGCARSRCAGGARRRLVGRAGPPGRRGGGRRRRSW